MILTKLEHIYLFFFAKRRFGKKGNALIRCLDCGNKFKSYLHENSEGLNYDIQCNNCEQRDYYGRHMY